MSGSGHNKTIYTVNECDSRMNIRIGIGWCKEGVWACGTAGTIVASSTKRVSLPPDKTTR